MALSEAPSRGGGGDSEIGQAALDAALDPFFVFAARRGPDGAVEDLEYRYVNAAGLRLYGRTAADVVGHGLLELFPSTRHLGIFGRYVAVLESGEPDRFEIPGFCENGVLGSFDVSVATTGTGIVVSARDTSGWHELEAAVSRADRDLGEAMSLLDTLVTKAPVGFGFVDADLRVVRANEMLAALSGRTAAEQVGRRLEDVVPADVWPQLAPLFDRALGGEAVRNVELHEHAPAGQRDRLLNLYPVRIDGAIVGVGAIVVDITEQKAAEDALHHAAQRFQAVIQHSSDIVLIIDAAGKVLFGSPSLQRVLGHDVAAWVGRSALDLLHPDDLDIALTALAAVVGSSEVQPAALYRVCHADGTWRWIESTGSNLLDDPDVGGVVVNARDVTERQEYKAKLERSVESMVETVSAVAEARDPYTAGHQRRVAELSVAIAEELGLDEEEVAGIRVAATIHDVGKIAVPAEILVRPGALSPIELAMVQGHAQAGHDIVRSVDFPWPVARMIREHHEHLDGSGYPYGLHGDEILLGARIIAVADTVEAMASHRPYRASLGVDAALAQVEADAGTRLDADAVRACVRLFRSGGFEFSDG